MFGANGTPHLALLSGFPLTMVTSGGGGTALNHDAVIFVRSTMSANAGTEISARAPAAIALRSFISVSPQIDTSGKGKASRAPIRKITINQYIGQLCDSVL